MAFSGRRSGEGVNTVGARRNPPISGSFVPGGQLAGNNQPPFQQGAQRQQPPANSNNFGQQQTLAQQFQKMPTLRPPQQPPPAQQNKPVATPPVDEKPMQVTEGDAEKLKGKPIWANKSAPKISRREKQRRRNVRLSSILKPKNAVMILNELVRSATYTVTDGAPVDGCTYTATVIVEGVSHVGYGRSKMEAKNMSAENALKYIVKNRQFSAFANKEDEDGDEKMETTDDGNQALPWQHVASFALFKLLNSWGEDPNLTCGVANIIQPPQNKPAKQMPNNAAQMNPLMLLNQMMPDIRFEELARTGTPPNLIFTFTCAIDGQTFTGTGPNKKIAKKMAAYAVCHKILAVQYPQEIYKPT